MALSGTLNTNAYDGRFYQVKWTATQSYANNSSTINWTVTALGGGTRWFAERTLKVIIAGKTVVDKVDRVERYDGQVASGAFTITHAADGSKTMPVSIQAAVYASTINCTGNTTFTLDQIPKQAIITHAPNFTDEDALTVTYRNTAGTAVTSLDMAIGWTGADDIKYRSVSKTGTSYTFNFTNDEKIKLQDAVNDGVNSKIVTIYLRTVISGVTYYSTIKKTLSIANAEPAMSPLITELNGSVTSATGSSTVMVLGQSRIQCELRPTAYKRATIASVTMRNGTNVINSATGIFNNASSNTFIFEVTDSRGNKTTRTYTRDAVSYIPLTMHASFENFTASGAASFNVSGNYFNGSFGAYNNYLDVEYRYAVVGSSYGAWQSVSTEQISGNSYTSNFSVSGLDYTKAYTFQVRARDQFKTVISGEFRFTGQPIFEWGKNDFKFNVPVTFAAGATGASGIAEGGGTDLANGGTINGDLTVTGNLRLKGSGNYGNTLYFGDGSYATMSEPSDDTLTVKASTINLNGTVKINDKEITSGTWTPTLNASAVSSYTTRQAWYQKVGNVVTVGFFIKATCNSGYNTTNVVISGLPFTPYYNAAGSGMCAGAYVSGGFNFQTFVAETNGNITTRVQQSNNSSATNLGTSASGCFYPSGGGDITLSGTICYTV